ncbi:MAG: double-strand break repair helicase AddA [Pseudomonadota bacterium]
MDDATGRQITAAAPDRSSWVSANAGSGKTRVLTDRVARLLFHGVPPERILCLTYTRAAAGEMQNRLFRRLGGWVMKSDEALAAELRDMGETGPLGPDRLGQARQVFARAIETPGGLKIQTIHAFCGALLRRFPLEAGISPGFSEIDERTAHRLQDEVLQSMAEGQTRPLIDTLAQSLAGGDPIALVRELLRYRQEASKPRSLPEIFQEFGLPNDADEGLALRTLSFSDADEAALGALMPVLAEAGGQDTKVLETLGGLSGRPSSDADLKILESAFLTGKTAKEPFSPKTGKVPKKAFQPALGSHLAQIDDLMARVAAARRVRTAWAAARNTMALHQFAEPFLRLYAQAKAARGWIDFDDLIQKTATLLTNPAVADWVLFRLDGGIDHILVDEAQDTSPAQWTVIELLAREFTTGQGARTSVPRTIFVVGDQKQSIYSFQGAAPDAFARMRVDFRDRLTQIDQPFQSVELSHSFRSSPAILEFVDATLQPHAGDGLGGHFHHLAFHRDVAGRVDIWPLIDQSEPSEEPPFRQPVDQVGQDHPAVTLAADLARQIKDLVTGGATIPTESGARRRLRYGDFLILVQRRSGVLFRELIRRLKSEGLPIAGADKLAVGQELAVKDLIALLSFLATPEDDLSLAASLRSPLFGWSEDDLFRLAQPREQHQFLWNRLRAVAQEDDTTLAVLDDMRRQTDFLRPYDLLERILLRHGGRNRLLARLGPEAEEGINALLNLALEYEAADVPSLTGFLGWIGTEEITVSRTIDEQSDEIRIMTVHGAKGREAPVVILPDTQQRRAGGDPALLVGDGSVLWSVPNADDPETIAHARDRARQIREEERMRLLYVAMTRAERWLIVCGAGKASDDCWHSIMQGGAQTLGAGTLTTPTGEGLRWQSGDWDGGALADAPDGPFVPVVPPVWIDHPAPPPEERQRYLSPSDLGGSKALPGEAGLDEEAALKRGSAIHTLLEHLPGTDPADALTLSRHLLPEIPGPELEALLNEVTALLEKPTFQDILGASSLAEVPVTGTIEGFAAPFRGVVDRLLVNDGRILAVDFKTNATVPGRPEDVPEGLLRQMGAYAEILMQIYPDRPVQTAILWTRPPLLMDLPHEIVRDALQRAATP